MVDFSGVCAVVFAGVAGHDAIISERSSGTPRSKRDPANLSETISARFPCHGAPAQSAAARFDNTIQLWNPATQTSIAALAWHTDVVLSLAFSPDGTILASGGRDSTMRLWNTATRTQTAVLSGHHQFVESVAFSPDGTTLASAGGDTTIRLWPLVKPRSSQHS